MVLYLKCIKLVPECTPTIYVCTTIFFGNCQANIATLFSKLFFLNFQRRVGTGRCGSKSNKITKRIFNCYFWEQVDIRFSNMLNRSTLCVRFCESLARAHRELDVAQPLHQSRPKATYVYYQLFVYPHPPVAI